MYTVQNVPRTVGIIIFPLECELINSYTKLKHVITMLGGCQSSIVDEVVSRSNRGHSTSWVVDLANSL